MKKLIYSTLLLCSAIGISLAQPGAAKVELKGTVEEMPSTGSVGTWKISGMTVVVNETTRIREEHGPFKVGAYVEVDGTPTSEGKIAAHKLETER